MPSTCPSMRTALPLPLPPGRGTPVTGGRVDDRKGPEGGRSIPFDDKLSALCAYRRAKGLCHTCGERWSREHKCASTIQLHVVEELWEMMTDGDKGSHIADGEGSQFWVDLMSISREAVNGLESSRTFRLRCIVQDQAVVGLVDSGSSHCFISKELARRLKGARQSIRPVQIRVANGGLLEGALKFHQCPWQVQGHNFSTTFRVLPLSCYDLIMGIDWLEQHSPMTVHWLKKVLSFWYQGCHVCLNGIKPESP